MLDVAATAETEAPRAAAPTFTASVRLCILGNTGSGKSWLGDEVKKILEMTTSSNDCKETAVSGSASTANANHCDVMHLDLLHFSSLEAHERRSPADKAAILENFYAGIGKDTDDIHTPRHSPSPSPSPSWVMEGVFGEYVQDAILKGKATAVLLLDTPFDTCKAQVTQRGGNHGTVDTEESREKLFKYASGYYTRDDARSEKGHRGILEDAKARGLQTATLRSREEVGQFLQAARSRILDITARPLSRLEVTEDRGEAGGMGEDGEGVCARGGEAGHLGAEGIAYALRGLM